MYKGYGRKYCEVAGYGVVAEPRCRIMNSYIVILISGQVCRTLTLMPVSNSSPLIHLSRLGKLGYARELFSSVTIPPTVRAETIERGKSDGYGDALALERLESDGWLRTSELLPGSKKVAMELSDVVGVGEAEAIALALEKKERLFMDDLKGRRTAELYRLETTTTLGIMLELLAKRAVTWLDYKKNVKIYGSQGWISGEIIQEFIEKGKELE